MSAADARIDLPDILNLVAEGRITIALHLDVVGDDDALTDEALEVIRQHKPMLLRRLAWDRTWADAEPFHGWVEWARGLPLPDWQVWRDRARAIQAKLPKNLEPIEALEESQRQAWQELVGRVGLDAPPPMY